MMLWLISCFNLTFRPISKRDLRKLCFAILREISGEEKAKQSESICHWLADFHEFQSARVVLSYISLKSEPDLSSLMWDDSHSAKTWGFSLVESDDTLTFCEVDSPEQQLQESEFGIREPIQNSCPKIDLETVDLILVPGVGFDPKTGDRLGRGKGHYDRFLSHLLEQRETQPLIIGVAFSQQLRELDPEEHDVPMDYLLSDLELSRLTQSS